MLSMNKTLCTIRQLPALMALTALATLLQSAALASGGDEFIENVFAPQFHVPAADLAAYATGKTGVLPGSYWRIFHFLAYRNLSGQPLTPAEYAAMDIGGWSVSPAHVPATRDSLQFWQKARMAQNGGVDIKIDAWSENEDYSSWLNCPDDAFENAIKTLNQRSSDKVWVKTWLANQDAVFANCQGSGERVDGKLPPRKLVLPAPLPAKAPQWLRHDYAYQSAAALFYAGQFDAARKGFLQIAASKDSPWQALGAYLATRCLIRKATLDFPDTRDPQQLPQNIGSQQALNNQARQNARDQLLQTAHNELLAQSKTYPPALALLGWVDIRLRPRERMQELGQQLASGKITTPAVTLLADYLVLMDKAGPKGMLAASDPMTPWIAAMQAASANPPFEHAYAPRSEALAYSRKQWLARREPLWLLPLLANARPQDVQAGQVANELAAAAQVAASHPAYQSLQYHLARLALGAGKPDQADAIAAGMLQQYGTGMSRANRNRWQAMRLVSGKSMEDFLQAALREAAAEPRPLPLNSKKKTKLPPPVLDDDFSRHLLQHLPLAQLKAVARSGKPVPAELPLIIWSRAVVLGDYASADEFTGLVMQGRDSTRELYLRFKNARDGNAKKQAASVIFANAPELHPYAVDAAGVKRLWGCRDTTPAALEPELDNAIPNFLSPQERQQAQKEQLVLQSLPKRSEYLAPVLLDWARASPSDPEVPKALHFFIASTRNECSAVNETDAKNRPQYSKEAFQLLHKQYPTSEWALKTKYFY